VVTQQSLGIGNNAMWPTGEGFDGLIDEVKAWDGPLSAAAVAAEKDTRIGWVESDLAKPVASFAFDEGAGAVARSEHRGHKGTLTGARWTTTARWGKAMMFDGVDDTVTIADHDTLDLRDEMTISAWVKPRTNRAHQVIAIKEAPWWRTYSLDATDWATNGVAYPTGEIGGPDAAQVLSGPAPLPSGKWSHVAYTFNGTTTRLYVNGDHVATGSGDPPPASDGMLRIGGTSNGDGENFDGVIDEVRLYDEALPIEQVRRDRDTSIILDAPATWREQGDGSTEPQGLGEPAPSASTSTRSADGPGLPGLEARSRIQTVRREPEPEPEPAPAAASPAPAAGPDIRAVRRGKTVTVAVTGASAGKLRVALTARRRGKVGACAGRVRASGRFSCRVALPKAGRRLRGLRAVVTHTPRRGKVRRIATAVRGR